jgi:hypothetical protein
VRFIEIIMITKLPESYADFHSTATPSTDHRWTKDPQMAMDFRQNCRGWGPSRPFEKRPVGQSRRPSGWDTAST